MDTPLNTQQPTDVALPSGQLMPVWVLYIELDEAKRRYPEFSLEELIQSALALYLEKYPQ